MLSKMTKNTITALEEMDTNDSTCGLTHSKYGINIAKSIKCTNSI